MFLEQVGCNLMDSKVINEFHFGLVPEEHAIACASLNKSSSLRT